MIISKNVHYSWTPPNNPEGQFKISDCSIGGRERMLSRLSHRKGPSFFFFFCKRLNFWCELKLSPKPKPTLSAMPLWHTHINNVNNLVTNCNSKHCITRVLLILNYHCFSKKKLTVKTSVIRVHQQIAVYTIYTMYVLHTKTKCFYYMIRSKPKNQY